MQARHSMSDMSGMGDTSSTSGMSGMKMYFHGSIGSDVLWFASWVPSSAGATVGVCIGVFLLAIFERWLAAVRRACDVSWQRGLIGLAMPKSSGPFYIASTPSSNSTRPQGETVPLSHPSSSTTNPDHPPLPPQSSTLSIDEKNIYPSIGDGVRGDDVEMDHLSPHLRLSPWEKRGRWSRPWKAGVDIPRGMLHALQSLLRYLLMLVAMTFNIWWIIAVVIGSGVGETLFGRYGSDTAEDH